VAIGIAVGAFAAAKFVSLKSVNRSLPAGILIGGLIIGFAFVDNLYAAIGMLIAIGICGGFYVVPLNALLQERGHESVGAGHAIAVQNLFENISMLLMIGFYTVLDKQGMPVVNTTVAFGALVLFAITILAVSRLRRP
jgi:LPLT family lysophospholipid transporter-like MFS transporter